MAETWLAVQRGDGGFEQRVCLKLIHEHLRDTDDFMRMFVREAAIAASLRHSNIVGVIDASPSEGCMALELVDGTDLGTVLAHAPSHRLEAPLVSYIALELCKALHYAHGRTRGGEFAGVIHRDISPANILVSYAGEIKLADFGIAKAIRATGDVGSGLRGKLSYMAPEQLLGHALDARTDLFSLGVLLYEAATGQLPFDGASDAETWERILHGKRAPLMELAPELPAGLCSAIEIALAVEPAQRFESAAAFLRALATLTPAPTVYRALGRLASRALPHHTLSHGDMQQPSLLHAPAGIPDSQLATRTLRRPVAQATRLLPNRPISAGGVLHRPRTHPAHWARSVAVGTAIVAALLALAAHAFRNMAVEPASSATAEWPAPAVSEAPPRPATQLLLTNQARRDLSSSPVVVTEPPRDLGSSPAVVAEAPLALPRPPDVSKQAATRVRAAPTEHAHPPPSRRTTGSASRAVPRRDPPAETGTLEVGVFPSGRIWVDGRLRGPAPLMLDLPAGPHVVAAGQSTPMVSREIVVRAGISEPLVFKLRGAKPAPEPTLEP